MLADKNRANKTENRFSPYPRKQVCKYGARLKISNLFYTGNNEKSCRPTARPVKSLQICRSKLRSVKKLTICWRPTAAAGGKKLTNCCSPRPVKRLQIGRPTAGYKACNMLATYGSRSIVKLNKIGEHSSILITTKQNVNLRCTRVKTRPLVVHYTYLSSHAIMRFFP
jgi:hypothetical protein